MKPRFTPHLLAALFAGLLTHGAQAALNEGEAAPQFVASAALDGKAFSFSLQEALKKGPVVVYFYPSAYTSGCNIQAHTFAEKSEQFAAAGASVVGVSLDSIARLKSFSADPDYCAGKLPVASDASGSIAKSYGLNVRAVPTGGKDTRGEDIDHGLAERTTFVVTPDGKVAGVIGGLNPKANVDKALETVQKLAGKPAR
ncbi:peroxiredoxin [Dechloromonas sp. XY25]|uniref:thioredoxin-dependent peroxiredoxin n=1 Tax=Dechloromonas hankyongensis TaxID=2908002 RepID=A0ABS9K433_9RHOO|nr:peroxiredoxin [Dechloromonas hankyongensis]MCG2577923.1 peroxiredoxin [Dechloromonas hankyongensis]